MLALRDYNVPLTKDIFPGDYNVPLTKDIFPGD